MTVEGATYAPPRLVYEGYVLLLYVDIGGPRKLEALLPRSDSEIVTVGKKENNETHRRGLGSYKKSRSNSRCGESMVLQRLQCSIGGKETGRYWDIG